MTDGVNANRRAGDYKILNGITGRKEQLTIHLKKGGGFLMKIQ